MYSREEGTACHHHQEKTPVVLPTAHQTERFNVCQKLVVCGTLHAYVFVCYSFIVYVAFTDDLALTRRNFTNMCARCIVLSRFGLVSFFFGRFARHDTPRQDPLEHLDWKPMELIAVVENLMDMTSGEVHLS